MESGGKTNSIGRLIFTLIVIFAIFYLGYNQFGAPKSSKNKHLQVLSYSSFSSLLGPGAEIKKQFEKICDCELVIIDGGDAGILLQKLKYLEKIDMVIGLDQFQIRENALKFAWKKLKPEDFWMLPENFKLQNETFAPFDWAPLTFIYRDKDFTQWHSPNLSSVFDLKKSKFISLQNPRSSSVGVYFIWWLWSQAGENEENYRKLITEFMPKIHSVSSGWDASYGLFQKGHAQMTFSYVTSLIYHWVNEKDHQYQALVDSAGHPFQIEYFGIPETCENCELAASFAKFLLEPPIQELFLQKNYMFPVLADLPALKELKLPELNRLKNVDQFLKNKDVLIEIWDQQMAKNQ